MKDRKGRLVPINQVSDYDLAMPPPGLGRRSGGRRTVWNVAEISSDISDAVAGRKADGLLP